MDTKVGGERSIESIVNRLCVDYNVPLWMIEKWPMDGAGNNIPAVKENKNILDRLFGNAYRILTSR